MAVTVERMRELLDSFPTPGSWHPYASAIGAIAADYRRAVETLETEGRWAAVEVEEARERLGAMIDPEGRHPFVDEIVETLQAMREALATLSS
jgi:hypothetical protein